MEIDGDVLSLVDPDTGDIREDLNIPEFADLADDIRAAFANDKAILVRKMNV